MIGTIEPDFDKTKEIIRIVLANPDANPKEIAKITGHRVTTDYAKTVRTITKQVLLVQRDG
jgi:hypothetical protein